MTIPFLDLKLQYVNIKQEIDDAIAGVIDKTAFVLGEAVEQFELAFADYCGCKWAVGVSSGTAALHLALLACGVGQGDEVITVPNTFAATVEAILYTRAKPIFVDIEPDTYNMKIKDVCDAITNKTKAIVPVHLYGQSADMDGLHKLCRGLNISIIEDACQAHGATFALQKVGSMGHVGCFSFYPSKNLGAYGDAGIITTNNKGIADSVRRLRNHGQSRKNRHEVVGYNYKMDGIQSAVLKVKLPFLDDWNRSRRQSAKIYSDLLVDANLLLPTEAEDCYHVYHLYVVRSPRRYDLRDSLAEAYIETGLHYPVPIHLQPAYRSLGYKKGDFPIAEWCSRDILSLPMYPELTIEQIEYVVQHIKESRHGVC
jgi:dTDP-4-amino-4,6-dideoxygalactose transaminase